ncbi:MAG: DUF4199 domain-containing protein, partial [Bacteroidales bacterium]|nr:DUF4199 domain-containing protein [Bacteroidales bacterium]
GVYLGLISIVFPFSPYVAGLVGENYVSWISLVISIAFVSWAMMNFRDKQNGGILTYKQGVGLGFITFLVGGIISSIFTYILFAFIDPGLIEELVQKSLEEAMRKSPEIEGNMDMVEKWTRMFVNPTAMAIMGVVMSAIGGIIISLILAAIFKKEPSVFDGSQFEEA